MNARIVESVSTYTAPSDAPISSRACGSASRPSFRVDGAMAAATEATSEGTQRGSIPRIAVPSGPWEKRWNSDDQLRYAPARFTHTTRPSAMTRAATEPRATR